MTTRNAQLAKVALLCLITIAVACSSRSAFAEARFPGELVGDCCGNENEGIYIRATGYEEGDAACVVKAVSSSKKKHVSIHSVRLSCDLGLDDGRKRKDLQITELYVTFVIAKEQYLLRDRPTDDAPTLHKRCKKS